MIVTLMVIGIKFKYHGHCWDLIDLCDHTTSPWTMVRQKGDSVSSCFWLNFFLSICFFLDKFLIYDSTGNWEVIFIILHHYDDGVGFQVK